MKDYRRQTLITLPIEDHAEALDIMRPSISTTINYLIRSLDIGIARKHGDSQAEDIKTVKKWQNTKEQLLDILSLYQ